MLNPSDVDAMPITGHYTVDGAPQSVGIEDAKVAILEGRSVRPGSRDVANVMACSVPGSDTASLLSRVYGFDPPKLPDGQRLEVPVAAAEDDTAALREYLDAAGHDKGSLQALATEYRVQLSSRWGPKRTADEINRVVASRLAAGEPAK